MRQFNLWRKMSNQPLKEGDLIDQGPLGIWKVEELRENDYVMLIPHAAGGPVSPASRMLVKSEFVQALIIENKR